VSVQRTQIGHETRFALTGSSDPGWVLVYGAAELVPSGWKILMVGSTGSADLLATARFVAPDEQTIRRWLTPITGPDQAAELARAADKAPPRTSHWVAEPPPAPSTTEPELGRFERNS
jgi:hypothetical protein